MKIIHTPHTQTQRRGVGLFCGGSSSTNRQTGQAPRACERARECEWESECSRGGVSVGRTYTYLDFRFLIILNIDI
jgi:hypothetical protein